MAVMCSTGCCMSIRRTRATMPVLLMLVLLGVVSTTTPQNCDTVWPQLQSKGYSTSHIALPSTGPVCGENTCCGEEIETKLVDDSRQMLDKYLKTVLTRMISILDLRAKRFDEFFKELMDKSKRDFHDMFTKTYGTIYLQNANVFTEFFSDLERYYNNGYVGLSKVLEKFFSILYLRMFTVINAQYKYDDAYLTCVEKYMNELKPFGDVPHKLSIQLKRSFVATRTLYKTLSRGVAVANNMLTIKSSEECGVLLTRLQYCGICNNLQGAGPCTSYCIYTLKECLQSYAAISEQWDSFVDAVDKVADRLLGPFNIEMVVEPINIKISEAIMNFQENGKTISDKIFIGCGKPTLDRRRRSAAQAKTKPNNKDEIGYQPINFNSKRKYKKTDSSSSTLEKIIRDIKQKVKETKQFWTHLPYQYCNLEDVSAGASKEGLCWNGETVGNFTPSKEMDQSTSPPILLEQSNMLQVLTSQLQNAHQGEEVDLQYNEDESLVISGSGSGDDGLGDLEDGDDDRDDEDLEPEIPQTTTKRPEPSSTTHPPLRTAKPTGSASPSFTRAMIHYVLPIVLIWFGGTISDLL